jgi:hypothetical protein
MSYLLAVIPAELLDTVAANDLVHAMSAGSAGDPPSSAVREFLGDLSTSDTDQDVYRLLEPADSRGVIIATRPAEADLLYTLLFLTMDRDLAVYDVDLSRTYDPRGHVAIDVSTSNGVTLPYVTPSLLRDLVLRPVGPDTDEQYFTLTRAEGEYIQTQREEDDGVNRLVYRDNRNVGHFDFHTRDSGLTADMLWAWAKQDSRWRTAVSWSALNIQDEDEAEETTQEVHVDMYRKLTFADTNGKPILGWVGANADDYKHPDDNLVPTGWVLYIAGYSTALAVGVLDFDSVDEALTKAEVAMTKLPGRAVKLRNEHKDGVWHNINAGLVNGALSISGHDLGPDDDEYEWWISVAAEDLPAMAVALGGESGTDIIDVLEQRWSGEAAKSLDTAIRSSGVEFKDTSYWRGPS